MSVYFLAHFNTTDAKRSVSGIRQQNETNTESQQQKLPRKVVTQAVVGVGQCVAATVSVSEAGAKEAHRSDFASSTSRSCEVVA